MSSQTMHTETLSSRERVVKALNHEEPDRVPIDLGGFQTGIHKKAYRSLTNYLGLKETIQDLDPVQGLAVPSETVLEKFHVDVRYVTAHGPDSFQSGIVRMKPSTSAMSAAARWRRFFPKRSAMPCRSCWNWRPAHWK